jgi:hypothetical protein
MGDDQRSEEDFLVLIVLGIGNIIIHGSSMAFG